MITQQYSVIDLFAGVGGLSLGAVRAGFNLALAVERDKNAIAAHRQNFPNTKHISTDIFQLDGDAVLQHAELEIGNLAGLVGGPPCQGFSVIGKRNVSDPRNNLFVKFFELTAQCLPKFFIVENVLGILSSMYDEVRERAFQHVRNNYTLLEPVKLRASDFGAPTSRERIFFVGYRPDALEQFECNDFAAPKSVGQVNVAEALKGLPQRIRCDWNTHEKSWRPVEVLSRAPFWSRISGLVPEGVGDAEAVRRYNEERMVSGCFGTRHSPEVRARYRRLKPGGVDIISRAVRLKLDGFCPTLRAGTGVEHGSFQAVRPIHPTLPRVITPREGARLQGFPDWFQFSPSKWQSFRQIGNSVSPILAEAVFRVIFTRLGSGELKGGS